MNQTNIATKREIKQCRTRLWTTQHSTQTKSWRKKHKTKHLISVVISYLDQKKREKDADEW